MSNANIIDISGTIKNITVKKSDRLGLYKSVFTVLMSDNDTYDVKWFLVEYYTAYNPLINDNDSVSVSGLLGSRKIDGKNVSEFYVSAINVNKN